MSKISAYTALSSAASNDLLPVVDVSDTTMAPTGTTKNITVANLFGIALAQVATTGNSGVALVNGTPNILSWTAPNDGQLHRALIAITLVVTSNATGGALALFSHFNGTSAINATILSGGQSTGVYTQPATGAYGATLSFLLLYGGDALTLQQYTALTGGAATVYAEIWAS